MAIYNPTNPPLFLSGRITSINGLDQYPYEDSTGIKATGAYYTFEITVDQYDQFPMMVLVIAYSESPALALVDLLLQSKR